eukprot:4008130-Prymnesium_polylepis.1
MACALPNMACALPNMDPGALGARDAAADHDGRRVPLLGVGGQHGQGGALGEARQGDDGFCRGDPRDEDRPGGEDADDDRAQDQGGGADDAERVPAVTPRSDSNPGRARASWPVQLIWCPSPRVDRGAARPHMACALPNMACALPNMACALPHMACTLPHMACALPNMACALPNMACTLPNMACTLPNMACALPNM